MALTEARSGRAVVKTNMQQTSKGGMRLLIDGTPLSRGGGVQTAVAFLVNVNQRPEIAWCAVLPSAAIEALPQELRKDPRIISVPKERLQDILQARSAIRRAERDHRSDICFTIFGPPYFRARTTHVAGFARGIMFYDLPRNPRIRHTGFDKVLDSWRIWMYKRMDRIIVETETARKRLIAFAAIDENRIDVVPNSVNPMLMTLSCQRPPRRDKTIILVPTSEYPHKNNEILAPVAASLNRLDPTLDFEIHVTIPQVSRTWATIAAQAQALNIGSRLKALGVLNLRQLGEAYLDASIILLPTLAEISTAVYPESFHFQRPLVTSNLDFARELCGDAAVLVDPHDANAISSALASVLHDRDRAARLVEDGRRRLASAYPTPGEKFAKQLCALNAALSNADDKVLGRRNRHK